MPESQGISRRDLLKRGAALGGAVVWATPVVQTLGMGRAFAANGTPVGGKDVSYVVISWQCNGATRKVKWEDGTFFTQGALPDCDNVGGEYSDTVPAGLNVVIDPNNSACIRVDVPKAEEFACPGESSANSVKAWVKAGSSQSTLEPCQDTALNFDQANQLACSAEA